MMSVWTPVQEGWTKVYIHVLVYFSLFSFILLDPFAIPPTQAIPPSQATVVPGVTKIPTSSINLCAVRTTPEMLRHTIDILPTVGSLAPGSEVSQL